MTTTNTTQNEVSLFGKKTIAEVPAYAAKDAGVGNENVDSTDQQMPQVKIMQSLSPEVKAGKAEEGKLLNTLSGEYTDHMYLVNLSFTKEYVIFKKRTLGGGWAGAFPTLELAKAKLVELPGGEQAYDITETAHHMCMLLNDKGEFETPIQMFMKATALPCSRNWNSQLAQKAEGARFASVWKLSTKSVTKNTNTYCEPEIEFISYLPEDLYLQASEAHVKFKLNAPAAPAAAPEAAA